MTEALAFCPGCGCNLVAEKPVRIGELTYEPNGFIWWGDLIVDVSAAQHLLLGSVVHAAGAVVRRTALAERIGNDSDGNVIEVLMYRLRKALRAAGAPANVIQTVVGRGYRLNVETLECR